MAKDKYKRCPTCKTRVKLLRWDDTWWWDEHYKDGKICPKTHLKA